MLLCIICLLLFPTSQPEKRSSLFTTLQSRSMRLHARATCRTLQFSDQKCEAPLKPNTDNYVEYSVFTQKSAALSFPASICGRWKVIKHVTKNVWGETIAVPDKQAIETSPGDCKEMKESKRFDGNQMKFIDGKWSHSHQPPTVGYWLQTVDNTTIGCMLEEIKLAHEPKHDEISTPLGMVDVHDGNYSHNHHTLIWDATYASQTDHTIRKLESGVATLSNSPSPHVYLLEDQSKQLAYHIYPVKRCLVAGCTNESDAYAIAGANDLFITTKSTKRQSSWKPPNGFPSELKIKNSDTYTADIAARFQYIRDQMLLNENELTRVVRSLQCDLRQIKHAQAAATAQYSGWLAAAHLKLPKCTKLSANRETVTALKCKPTIVDFKTEVTKCGAQPRYKNFTINVDGWELVEFKPCY